MWQHAAFIGIVAVVSSLLAGCLYPEERLAQNQVPSTFYLEATQKAIDQYHTDTGVLPIVTKPLDTPIFEKYEVDFRMLMPKYVPDVPANAFEKGGVYKYVLVDVETKPLVRLANLAAVSKVADVQTAVNRYVSHYGKLPVEKEIGNGYFTISGKAIGMQDVQVNSSITNQWLPLIMNERGEVGIDYAADIATTLRNNPKLQVPPQTDPRYVLARESMFVPIKSFPYELVNGEPRLLPLIID
ncbi:hypothetical protein [Brevibacillus migulae]|uniref:hypothetical protein n=1 Tax=Brevibacillus migulae TaxID=1644114 RepID=UPI00106ED6BC|nr:hypothetical protein [Brevibacillus migulae]